MSVVNMEIIYTMISLMPLVVSIITCACLVCLCCKTLGIIFPSTDDQERYGQAFDELHRQNIPMGPSALSSPDILMDPSTLSALSLETKNYRII